MTSTDICYLSAGELVALIAARELSVCEVMEAHLRQIEAVNPKVNAIVTLLPEQAMGQAAAADERLARGEPLGPLGGLPVGIKDLVPTKGIRTTFGSPVFKDYIPDHDAAVVQRLKSAGAIVVGKTNTPEFGAGSNTFNPVFGETLNPYDLTKTCGGSSGGAAVSLACRMLPLADGTDTGGSLRNPASFCNVVGFRTSYGRVPFRPNPGGWAPLSVAGPLARTVADNALMLSAIAGPDPRSPLSLSDPGTTFSGSLERDFSGVPIAWSRDFGELPVDPRVTDVIDSQQGVFESLGCRVEADQPDFSDAHEVFQILRAWRFELRYGSLLPQHRQRIKETVVWNVEAGTKLSGPQIGWAEVKRTEIYQRMCAFMDKFAFLILPVSQVPPFDVKQAYITEINGVAMETYIDWMKSCYYITVTGLPAMSVPCGFTSDGLPVGVQIVGRPRDERGVLQLAHAFEQATGFGKRLPPLLETLT